MSFSACIFSSQNSKISIPSFPNPTVSDALESLPSSRLIRVSESNLDANSSDRNFSPLYSYLFNDSSRLLIVNARVRKRDDFKIETYGLLTKGVDQIYLENSRFISNPNSLRAFVDKKPVYQSCIIPGSNQLSDIDVRLTPLTSFIQRESGSSKNLITRVLGIDRKRDYSCFIITFFPNANLSEDEQLREWTTILKKLQNVLASRV
jgi:hypothetical protein